MLFVTRPGWFAAITASTGWAMSARSFSYKWCEKPSWPLGHQTFDPKRSVLGVIAVPHRGQYTWRSVGQSAVSGRMPTTCDLTGTVRFAFCIKPRGSRLWKHEDRFVDHDAVTKSQRRYVCPVCGYPGLQELPWQRESPSDEICPSCGTHFGYDDAVGGDKDARPAVYARLRGTWKGAGCQWSSPGADPPPGWDPHAQLKSVDQVH